MHEWRFLSSWGKAPETTSSSRNKAETDEEKDCHMRRERQRLRQYVDFMKKVELDPYKALFGKSWLRDNGEDTEPKAAKTQSPTSPKETAVPKTQRPLENWPSKPKPGGPKIFEDRDVRGRQPQSEMMHNQKHIQEYVIDPITNRKVLKTSASPTSTVEHIRPQLNNVEKALKIFHERWNRILPTSLDRHFIMVEHAQASSISYPPSKDTPPLKAHNGNGWLAQEGFGNVQEPKAGTQAILHTHAAEPNTTAMKIESALDRHLSSKSTNGKAKKEGPQLQYKPEENKTEDVDLLRPSDVRASAGLRGKPPKETDVEKQARRQILEKNYDSCALDRASQSAGEAAGNKLVQKREDPPVERSTVPELRFGSWLEKTMQDARFGDKEASIGPSAVWVNELSDARDFDPVSVDQISDSTQVSKNDLASKPLNAVAPEAQAEVRDVRDKANRLRAQIVPFKAKLDAMKADYDFLRQEWLQEIRRVKEKDAKMEEAKAQETAKRAREVHEEEVKTQKVAMEAMEMRSSDGSTNTARNALATGIGNGDGAKPASRRLQSFLQGEGDMASNVHEFAGRDRWYKRKAPHAMDAKDAEMDAKLKKLATDRALIREVRCIYEDTYGTIDTKHRQPDLLLSPSIKHAGQPISSSSGRVTQNAQLPPNAASITGSSQELDEAQTSEALRIIQKLFGQLREAQSVIQEYRCQTKQALGPSDQETHTFKTPSAFDKSVIQIARTSEQLARLKSGGMIGQGSVEATAAAESKKSTTKRPISTTASESTNLDVQKATKLNAYCILAYDPATQKVRSAETTTLAPFSKEESLLPLDALNFSSNPGKFLPHVMSLGEKGYVPVSGTSNILVFKKEVTLEELAGIKMTDARKEPNPTHNAPEQSTTVGDILIAEPGYWWSFIDILKSCQETDQPLEGKQQKVKGARNQAVETINQAVATIMEELQKAEAAGKTAMDGIKPKEQAFEEAQKQRSASSSSRSDMCSDKVHRQETVFSGSRPGQRIVHSVNAQKSKRRRRRSMKRMLMAGAFTAACCYCVGVASEMMRSL